MDFLILFCIFEAFYTELMGEQNSKETQYDVIVQLDSLLGLRTGVEVKFPGLDSKLAMSKLRDSKWEVSIVAILGHYNTGKSFLLNELSGFSFASGVTLTTHGLSFKQLIKNEKMGNSMDHVFVDTAGLESPVRVTNERTLPDLADRKSTDAFLHDLVFSLSDLFVVVLNHVSVSEQENLTKLTTLISRETKRNLNPWIIVVHNWKDCKTKENMNKLWEKQVKQLLPDSKEKTEIVSYNKKMEYKVEWLHNDVTRHVCLVAADSSIGKERNPAVIALIRKWLTSWQAPTNRSFSLHDQLIKQATALLPEYVKPHDKEEVKVQFNEQTLKLTANFKELRGFQFNTRTGIVLGINSSLKVQEFTSKEGLLVLVEISGLSVSVDVERDCFSVAAKLDEELSLVINTCDNPPEFTLSDTSQKIPVDSSRYDTSAAKIRQIKGFLVFQVPYFDTQKKTLKF